MFPFYRPVIITEIRVEYATDEYQYNSYFAGTQLKTITTILSGYSVNAIVLNLSFLRTRKVS